MLRLICSKRSAHKIQETKDLLAEFHEKTKLSEQDEKNYTEINNLIGKFIDGNDKEPSINHLAAELESVAGKK